MKKTILLVCLSFTLFTFSQKQSYWKTINKLETISEKEILEESFNKEGSIFFELDYTALKQILFSAPKRESLNRSYTNISFPNHKGELEEYEMYEASNFEPSLQALFPEIRSYVGIGVNDKTAIIRISTDSKGITAVVNKADTPTYYMEAANPERTVYSLYKSTRTKGKIPFTCSTVDEVVEQDILDQANAVQRSSTGELLEFRLAMSVTAEYTNIQHARLALATPKTSALSAINTTMTRVNGVFETDFAIHMNLVNNMTIIYDNGATDPYSGTSDGNYNTVLQSTLTSVVGEANYDVGHLMAGIGNNGNAGCIGCVCVNGQKGSGYTTSTTPYGEAFDIDYVAHELGHQFGANHTFSHGSEGTGVNKEVGSGVTVMGYAGITAYDTHMNSIDVFHSASIAQVQANMASKSCPTTTAITHSAPVVNAGSNYTIPLSTPFMLTGSATDAGGAGGLTYTWEQNDNVGTQTGANSGARENKPQGPNWSCYLDSSSPIRHFPIITSTLNNSRITPGLDVNREASSNVGRTLNFRLTARDNVLGIGQTNFDDMVVTVSGTRGPFDVTSQNVSGINYQQGSTQTVTWAVNNTTLLAGSANVDIFLSTDGGYTYPITLASNTPNDGSHDVVIPNVFATNCRIMVKPTGNIYYDINTTDFAIGFDVSTAETCNQYNFSPALAIPDGQAGGGLGTVIGFTFDAPDTGIISDINVLNVNLPHTYMQDIILGLESPEGTQVMYVNGVCTNQNGFNNTDLDSQATAAIPCTGNTNSTIGAGPYRPSSSFNAFNGENPNGTWTFLAADTYGGDTGNLNSLTLEICTSETTITETPIPCGQISTTWNGSSWSNGAPLRNVAVTISGNYTSSGDLEACSLTVTNNAQVTINSGDTFIVGGDVTVDAGATLTVENNAALRQIDDLAVNTGNIVVRRDSSPMIRLDYTAWSSPVIGQQLLAFSPNTVVTRFYEYLFTGTTTPTAYQSLDPSTNFVSGKGYMIRAADNASSTVAASHNGVFSGVPVNGIVNQSVGLGYNLLGNPYPSPIDANRFLAANSSIGTLYFWTNTTPASGGSYPQNNFAAYTTLGGTAAFASAKIPNGRIQTGQGFYILTSSAGTVTFTNDLREKSVVSSQFFRTSEIELTENIEKHRIWLNLNDTNTSYNQILVGYMQGATNGFDNMIDGRLLESEKPLLYNIVNDEKYVIQGRALPFTDEDSIPLGLKIITAGTYSISIESFDGLFESQDIFLKDNTLNTIHDLKQSAYTFSSSEGIFENRFEIVFKNSTLSNEDFINSGNLIVYSANNLITINASENIKQVSVFDVLGRNLYNNASFNEKSTTINSILPTNQALFVKVELTNGQVVTKKIAF